MQKLNSSHPVKLITQTYSSQKKDVTASLEKHIKEIDNTAYDDTRWDGPHN